MNEITTESESKDLSEIDQGASTTIPTRRKSGYIATLDGWRTIAVGAVILYHARAIHLGSLSLAPIQDFGNRGVQLFFAISGILICSRLLEEQRLFGRISLKGFYLRRLFRIQPAAFAFLFAIGLLTLFKTFHPTLPATLSSLFSYRNLFNALGMHQATDDRYTAHFWSLGVEEQFYFLLPFLLILVRKHLFKLLVPVTLFAFVWPILAHHFGLADRDIAYQRTDLAIRDLLVPAVFAVALNRPVLRKRMVQLSTHGFLLWGVVFAVIGSELFLGGHPTSLITCIGFPIMVLSTMLHPHQWVGRFLENPVFVFGGRISYSVYLWQELFFIHRPETSWLRFLQITPVNLLASLVLAIGSYYLIEKPFIRMGHRLAPPATPGRNDLR
jgi:peptidoglycan/LPS O-acetylase OafA/YrhL